MLLNKFFIKFKYLLLIINILLINNINLAKPIKASPETNTISTDYLKNIPSNLFYIIGPGDTFEIEGKVASNALSLHTIFGLWELS